MCFKLVEIFFFFLLTKLTNALYFKYANVSIIFTTHLDLFEVVLLNINSREAVLC